MPHVHQREYAMGCTNKKMNGSNMTSGTKRSKASGSAPSTKGSKPAVQKDKGFEKTLGGMTRLNRF